MKHSRNQVAVTPEDITAAEDLPPAVDRHPAVEEPLRARSGRRRRRLVGLTAGVLLLVAVLTVGLWAHFHATHIVTGNALVRAHLSELGVREVGVVQIIHVDAGDNVVEGQLLARLDDRHLLARRDAAEAAAATLNERIALADAELAFEKQLAEAGSPPAEEETAQQTLDSLALREARLQVLRSLLLEAKAELAQVEADIASTSVYAPANGAVIRRLAQPGMAVDTGSPILSLWLTDRTWIEAWVPEEDLADVEPGNPVQVSFPALPGERFAGVIARVGLATDFEMPMDYLPQTRESRMRTTPQVGLEIRLDSPPPVFRPGMSAVVNIRRNPG